MKRILNLNDFSFPVLSGIIGIGLGLPAVLFVFSYRLHLEKLERVAVVMARISAGLLALFFVLVIIEQIQDHLLYRQYLRELGKVVHGECPYCGNRKVRAFDRFCAVCGKELIQERDNKPG